MKTMLATLLLAVVSAQDKKIPAEWSAWRYSFEPSDGNKRSGYSAEGYYYYDATNQRKSHIEFVRAAEREPTLTRDIELYKEKVVYEMELSRDGKVTNCRKSPLDRPWYSHDVDTKARSDGSFTIGSGYVLDQFFAEENADRGRPGSRYQTFSSKDWIPVRDDRWNPSQTGGADFRYEQFENVTLAKATKKPMTWAEAWTIPDECKKMTEKATYVADMTYARVTPSVADRLNAKAPKVPTQWKAHRVSFDPDAPSRGGKEGSWATEGEYYYDAVKLRKASIFRFTASDDQRGAIREIELYGKDGKGVGYRLQFDERNRKWGPCQEFPARGWYSHNPEQGARYDGQVTVGSGYALEQYVSETSGRRPGEKGWRYQTYSKTDFIPVRDDYGNDDTFVYEQFENVTLASKDPKFAEAFEVPDSCKKTPMIVGTIVH